VRCEFRNDGPSPRACAILSAPPICVPLQTSSAGGLAAEAWRARVSRREASPSSVDAVRGCAARRPRRPTFADETEVVHVHASAKRARAGHPFEDRLRQLLPGIGQLIEIGAGANVPARRTESACLFAAMTRFMKAQNVLRVSRVIERGLGFGDVAMQSLAAKRLEQLVLARNGGDRARSFRRRRARPPPIWALKESARKTWRAASKDKIVVQRRLPALP
jgi:hypothetical protein